MCNNMDDLKAITELIYEMEQKKAEKKKELDSIDKQIKELKNQTSSYMKKRKKNLLAVGSLEVLFTEYVQPVFDKNAFISGEENGEATYKKYVREVPMKKVTVRICKA